jgi:hypothetical protein
MVEVEGDERLVVPVVDVGEVVELLLGQLVDLRVEAQVA